MAGMTQSLSIPAMDSQRRTVQVVIDGSDEKEIVGTFSVAFRPNLIRKEKPLLLELSRKALENDEVFLILLLIYSEAKRQEESVRFAFATKTVR